MAFTLGRPPGPFSVPLIGVLPAFRANPAQFLLNTAREYGDISYFRLGLQRVYLVNRPDLIEEILVHGQRYFTKSRMLQRARVLLGDGLLTSEGEFHTKQRRLVQPAFYRQRLASYADVMARCAGYAADRWSDRQTLDVNEEMSRLTLAIVGETLFGTDVESEASEVGAALTDVIRTFELMLMPLAGLLQKLPFTSVRRARAARARLDATVYRIIGERRASGVQKMDLLGGLLDAETRGADTMSDRQIRDEVMTLLLAGHETTATALSWTLYLLSQYPEAEARMRAEVDEVLGNRAPDHDDVLKLDWTLRVFAESMRLYPPAWAIGRLARSEYRLFNYIVPAGSVCIVSPYAMHRHPRFWPQPESFDPDRFTAEAEKDRPRFAYFPFGGGERVCLGERFAWMEGVIVLATLTQRWRFRLAGERPEPHPQITLRPKQGLRMTVERVLA